MFFRHVKLHEVKRIEICQRMNWGFETVWHSRDAYLSLCTQPHIDSFAFYETSGLLWVQLKDSVDIASSKIQRRWRRHRLQIQRDKNDAVIHGLAQYFGHPSRQVFDAIE